MNILTRFQLSRDAAVTVANLVDELEKRKGDCDVTVGEEGRFRLSDLAAEIRAIDSFLRREIALEPGQQQVKDEIVQRIVNLRRMHRRGRSVKRIIRRKLDGPW